MKIRKLLGFMLALCLVLGFINVPVSAKTVKDAHGNDVELDETLQAYSQVTLVGAEDAARKGETNLGDLWTDALLWFAESGEINAFFDEDDVAAGNTGISKDAAGIVALWNGGNLKSDIAVGTFGSEEMMSVLPYPNKVAVVYMTGAELREALEAASQGLPYTEESAAACAALMQVAGLNYTINTEVAYDAGEAYGKNWYVAKSVNRVNITTVNDKAYDEKAVYAVITSNANFNGMDSSYMFKQAAEKNELSTITNAVVRDAVWMYIEKKLENVVTSDYAEAQKRITLVTTSDTKNDTKEETKEDTKAETTATTYTVKQGDCLWAISKEFYGSGKYWRNIENANKDQIKVSKLIFPGQMLVIPELKK